jgi:hypothetical protein
MIDIEKIVAALAENCTEIFSEVAFKDKDTIVINSDMFERPHTLVLKEGGKTNTLMKLKDIR